MSIKNKFNDDKIMFHRYIVQDKKKSKKNCNKLLFPILLKEQAFFAVSTSVNYIEK